MPMPAKERDVRSHARNVLSAWTVSILCDLPGSDDIHLEPDGL